MTIEFDLAAAFQQIFGYESDAFSPKFNPVSGDKPLVRVEAGALAASPYYATDVTTGVEYFMPVTISYPDNTPLSADDQALLGGNSTGILNNWNLPFPVISISSKKTIVETPLTERRGTVKELINIEDFVIKIKGMMIVNSNDFPEAAVTTLRNLFECNVPLSIKCPLTDIYLLRPDRSGSDQVVIKSLNLPDKKGVKHVVPYELELVSDEPFNLIDIS